MYVKGREARAGRVKYPFTFWEEQVVVRRMS